MISLSEQIKLPRKSRDKTGRITKLIQFLGELNPIPGKVLYVGVHSQQTIEAALKFAGLGADITKTNCTSIRDDGVEVPVYKLTFK